MVLWFYGFCFLVLCCFKLLFFKRGLRYFGFDTFWGSSVLSGLAAVMMPGKMASLLRGRWF